MASVNLNYFGTKSGLLKVAQIVFLAIALGTFFWNSHDDWRAFVIGVLIGGFISVVAISTTYVTGNTSTKLLELSFNCLFAALTFVAAVLLLYYGSPNNDLWITCGSFCLFATVVLIADVAVAQGFI